MSIIDKLKEDFLPKIQEKKNFEYVHEDGTSTKVYFKTVANAAQTDKYLPLLSENKIEGYVELLMQRALNEDGSKMFKPKDKQALMVNVDPNFLTDVGNAILGVDGEDESAKKEVEEIAKK